MSNIKTFFKVDGLSTKSPGFGIKCHASAFNYVDPVKGYESDRAGLLKHMADSFKLSIDIKHDGIKELKLTNLGVLTWEDYWIDSSGFLVDPKIESLNLQKNSLIHFNCNLSRDSLKRINVESNMDMQAFILYGAPNLEYLNLSNCTSLTNINLGNNRKIKALLAKNCNLTGQAQERLLRDFTPTVTSEAPKDFLMFRKNYETLLDLRGSIIDWGNRRVASKIRLLLCNNWLVLWDNPPPTSVVPPQMYSFFTTNIEDSLIKQYYGG